MTRRESPKARTIRGELERRGYSVAAVWWEPLSGHDGVYEGGWFVAIEGDPAGEVVGEDLQDAMEEIERGYPYATPQRVDEIERLTTPETER